MPKTYYNKLVRDRIPEIIKSQGKTCEIEILDDGAYLKALEAKLDEEVKEYLESHRDEELVDIFTVFMYILIAKDIDMDALNQLVFAKGLKRGFFDEQILLKWVDDGKEESDDSTASE